MAHFKFLKTLGMNPQIDHDINFAEGNVLISLSPPTAKNAGSAKESRLGDTEELAQLRKLFCSKLSSTPTKGKPLKGAPHYLE